MLSTAIPPKIAVPFGTSGPRNTIPVPSQIGLVAGAASFTDGFPPLTMTDPTAGGVPPDGKDMNGILYELSQAVQWLDAGGGLPQFDAAFSTAVGGYPYGAMLQSQDNQGIWVSLADNNTVNPDTGPGSWVPVFSYGSYQPTLAGSNITLTPLQANKEVIVLAGTLTANVTLTFPLWQKSWKVMNFCGGAFSVFAKTAPGAPVLIHGGGNEIYGDGANVINFDFLTPNTFQSQQSLLPNGYQKLPGGVILQWGTTGTFPTDSSGNSVTFPIAFPNNCFAVCPVAATDNGISTTTTNYAWGIYSKSTTGFLVHNDSLASIFNWFAIGN